MPTTANSTEDFLKAATDKDFLSNALEALQQRSSRSTPSGSRWDRASRTESRSSSV